MATDPKAAAAPKGDGTILDPVERLSEILFGLIMALTFTGSIHAAQAGREDLRLILFGAIGCNVAWGIVDAVMYLLAEYVRRSRMWKSMAALRAAASNEQARAILEDHLPCEAADAMAPADFEGLRKWLLSVPAPAAQKTLTAREWRGAGRVFLLVTLSTFPVVLPLLFVRDPTTALRLSHAVALTMLFLIGSALGRFAGMRAWLVGLAMLMIGVVLAGLTILLGG